MTGTSRRMMLIVGAGAVAALVGMGFRMRAVEEENRALRAESAKPAPSGPVRAAAATQSVAPEPAPVAVLPAPEPPKPATAAPVVEPVPDVTTVLRQAQDALDKKDAKSFTAAFLALIDAGAPAYDAIVELTRDIERFENACSNELMSGLTARLPKLGGLMDFILQRDGDDIAGAGMFAGVMMQMGAQSSLSAPRLMELLKQSLPAGNDSDAHNRCVLIKQALGQRKDSTVIPELEALASERHNSSNAELLGALGLIGGREAMASLGRLLEKTTDRSEAYYVAQAMKKANDPEANEVLRQLAFQHRDDPAISARLWEALAERPENVDRALDHARNSGVSKEDLRAIVYALLGEDSPLGQRQATETVRNLIEGATGERRDVVLAALVSHKDAQATAEFAGRLDSGRLSAELSGALGQAGERFIREHLEAVRTITADARSPLEVRQPSFWALQRVDQEAAVAALLNGFAGQSEVDRVAITKVLGGLKRGVAGTERAAMERILATDESALVKAEAQQFLRK